MKIDECKGREIINTRVTEEFKKKFMDLTYNRCLSASMLIRLFLSKFVKEPDETLEFLLGR